MRAIVVLAIAIAASPAYAQVEGAGTLVVRNRLHPAESRHEIQPGVGISINNKLTQHTEFRLIYSYNVSENLALELAGGFSGAQFAKHTDVAGEVRSQNIAKQGGGSAASSIEASDFSDLGTIQWSGFGNVRWAPAYGKINLASELAVKFHWYLSGGVGAAQIHRESIAYCQAGAVPGDCAQPLVEDRMAMAGNASSGFLFYLSDWLALRTELRYVVFPDNFVVNFKRDESGNAVGDQPSDSPGLTAIPFIALGASILL